MIVRLAAAAHCDILDVTEWYARRDPNVARRFVAAVEAAMDELAEFPCGPPRLETWSGQADIRRIRLHRFPYVIVFEVSSEEIVIWSVSHTKRKPNHWQDRRTQKPE